MRQNSHEIGKGREHEVGSHKGIECGGRAKVNEAQECAGAWAEQDGIVRVLMFVADASEGLTKWQCVVTSQRPQSTTKSDVEANHYQDGGYEGKYE